MSTKQYDYAVVIGRFQPLHKGHISLIGAAHAKADKVIVVIGSANSPRSIKNPWTVSERIDMIVAAGIPGLQAARNLFFVDVEDQAYQDQAWLLSVQKAVLEMIHGPYPTDYSANSQPLICLVGCNKDETTYYLEHFKGVWPVLDAEKTAEDFCASDVRAALFSMLWESARDGKLNLLPRRYPVTLENWVSEPVLTWIIDWCFRKNKVVAENLLEEWKYVAEYKTATQTSRFPVQFLTTDAVVVQNGSILMVKRGNHPGKGLWALPGGFVQTDETFRDACLRELVEETGIKVPRKVLAGSIVEEKVFDSPRRSVRGRVVTVAFSIRLAPGHELPRVTGSDDAAEAWWFPISEVLAMRDQIHEDHLDIIRYFVSRM